MWSHDFLEPTTTHVPPPPSYDGHHHTTKHECPRVNFPRVHLEPTKQPFSFFFWPLSFGWWKVAVGGGGGDVSKKETKRRFGIGIEREIVLGKWVSISSEPPDSLLLQRPTPPFILINYFFCLLFHFLTCRTCSTYQTQTEFYHRNTPNSNFLPIPKILKHQIWNLTWISPNLWRGSIVLSSSPWPLKSDDSLWKLWWSLKSMWW